MKALLIVLMFGFVFAGIVSETKYQVVGTRNISNAYIGTYTVQGDGAFLVSFTGQSQSIAWSVPTSTILTAPGTTAAGYNVSLYSTTTVNVLVGVVSK